MSIKQERWTVGKVTPTWDRRERVVTVQRGDQRLVVQSAGNGSIRERLALAKQVAAALNAAEQGDQR